MALALGVWKLNFDSLFRVVKGSVGVVVRDCAGIVFRVSSTLFG